MDSIGPYTLVRRLGEGGMGTVYVARHADLGRDVALKVLRTDRSCNGEDLARFRREMRIAASLSHPNLVKILDGGVADKVDYIAMELLAGQPLSDRLATGAIHWVETIRIGVGITAGLVELHALGIVHRDIKPANIFLGADGSVKILDMGLARRADSTLLTQDGGVGTPCYVPPEVIESSASGPEIDIWAVGCVLHEMLTGRRVFAAPEFPQLLKAILKQPIPPPHELDPEVPADLSLLILEMLIRQQTLRIQPIRVVHERLYHLLAGRGISLSGSLPLDGASAAAPSVPALAPLPDPTPPRCARVVSGARPLPQKSAWWRPWIALSIVICGLMTGARWTAQVASNPRLSDQAQSALGEGRTGAALQLALRAGDEELESARSHVVLAGCFTSHERHEDARRELTRAIELDPRTVDTRVSLANTLLAIGDLDAAEREAWSVRLAAPQVPLGYRLLMTVETRKGQLARAEQHVRECLRMNPASSPLMLIELARVLKSQGRSSSLEPLLHQIFEESLAHPGMGIAALNFFKNQNRIREADALFQKALTHPEFPVTEVSSYYCQKGDFKRATQVLRDHLHTRPPTIPVLRALAMTLLPGGLPEEAERVAVQAVELDPRNPMMHSELGRIQAARGDLEGAERSLRRALDLAPGYTDALMQLVSLMTQNKRLPEARLVWEATLQRRPAAPWLAGSYATWLYLSDDLATAEPLFRRALACRWDAVWAKQLGRTLMRLRRAGDAEQLLREAVRRNPSDAEALHVLSVVLKEQKKMVEAEKALRDAARLEPANVTILTQLADQLDASGRTEEALQVLLPAVGQETSSAGGTLLVHVLLRKLGRAEEARSLLDAALKAAPADNDLLWRRMQVLVEQGDLAGAERIGRQVLKSRPQDVKRQQEFAMLLYGSGKTAEALRRIEQIGRPAR